MSTSNHAPHASDGAGQSLHQSRLVAVDIVFFVIAAVAPLVGMTGALPAAIVLGNAAAAPGAYLLVGLVLLLFSIGHAAMGHRVTNVGAFFAYIGRGLGLHLGVGSAFPSLLAHLAIHLSLYGLFGGLVAEQVGGLPWWGWSSLAWCVVTYLSLRRVDVGARILGVLPVLELMVLIITSTAIFIKGGLSCCNGALRSILRTSWWAGWRAPQALPSHSPSLLSLASRPLPSTERKPSNPRRPCLAPPTWPSRSSPPCLQ